MRAMIGRVDTLGGEILDWTCRCCEDESHDWTYGCCGSENIGWVCMDDVRVRALISMYGCCESETLDWVSVCCESEIPGLDVWMLWR